MGIFLCYNLCVVTINHVCSFNVGVPWISIGANLINNADEARKTNGSKLNQMEVKT